MEWLFLGGWSIQTIVLWFALLPIILVVSAIAGIAEWIKNRRKR